MTEIKIHSDLFKLKKTLDELKSKGKKIVFTNGCFDILHAGHVSLLERAKSEGDCLVVAVNSDSSVRKIKGPSRPINTELDRMRVLAGLGAVDFLIVFSEATPEKLIREIKPDILIKGGDWSVEQIVGGKFVESTGGVVKSLPLVEGYSSSSIINKFSPELSRKSSSQMGGEIEKILEKIRLGDLKLLGRVLSFVDTDVNLRAAVWAVVSEAGYPERKKIFAFSGPPGSGKSSLLASVSEKLSERGKKIGVVAVDPSSRITGGAFLGDRVRTKSDLPTEQYFFRSVGSKGVSGGISESVETSVGVLQYAGYELILIETVGGGQSDVDVSDLTENVILVQSPSLGDTIQMMKSGLNEYAKAFVVHKSDIDGAREFSEDLQIHLEQSGHDQIPVFLSSSIKQEGLSQITDWILSKV